MERTGVVLLMILPLAVTSVVTPRRNKEVEVKVCQGEDAIFNLTLHTPIVYAHFGEKKKGLMGPVPMVIVVDKNNSPTNLNTTVYSERLTYEGRVQEGLLRYVLHSTQVNDTKRTYLVYVKEYDKAMHSVEFNLRFEDNCTNTDANDKVNSASNVTTVKPPDEKIITTSKPSTSTTRTKYAPKGPWPQWLKTLVKVVAGVGSFLTIIAFLRLFKHWMNNAVATNDVCEGSGNENKPFIDDDYDIITNVLGRSEVTSSLE